MYLMGVYLVNVHLIGIHLISMYFMSVHLTGVYLIGVYPISVHLRGREPQGRVPYWMCTSWTCISWAWCVLRLSDFSIWGLWEKVPQTPSYSALFAPAVKRNLIRNPCPSRGAKFSQLLNFGQ